MTDDEQTASNFTHLWVKGCHEVAKVIELSPEFEGKVETFEIVDEKNVPPRSPS